MDLERSDAEAVLDAGRPTQVTVGAIVLIALGAFMTLLGMAVMVLGMLFLDVSNLPAWVDRPSGDFGAGSLAFGAGGAAFGLAQVVTGIHVLRGTTWAEAVGIVLAVVGALVAGLGLLQGFGATAIGVTTIFLPIVVAYLYAAWGLATTPRWFART
jgi:hypothetical protein